MNGNQEGEYLERPLAQTLIDEFQSLKEKFKGDDDFMERGKFIKIHSNPIITKYNII